MEPAQQTGQECLVEPCDEPAQQPGHGKTTPCPPLGGGVPKYPDAGGPPIEPVPNDGVLCTPVVAQVFADNSLASPGGHRLRNDAVPDE